MKSFDLEMSWHKNYVHTFIHFAGLNLKNSSDSAIAYRSRL